MTVRAVVAVALACVVAASVVVGAAVGAGAAETGATADDAGALAVAQAATESEPNDDAGNATRIEVGTAVVGDLASGSDVDVFAFDAEAGARYAATLDRGGDGWATLLVAGPDLRTLDSSVVRANGTANVSVAVAESGEFYVAVLSDDGSGSYDLSVERRATPSAAGQAPPDPESDVLGWEDGYWHNESVVADQSDGLTPEERQALLARTKARVEVIRGLEFSGNVSFDIVARDEFSTANDKAPDPTDEALPPSNVTDDATVYFNQVYEALFMVNESTDARTALEREGSLTTLAFYRPSTDEMVVVTNDPDRPVVREDVLAHELVHALQDQHLEEEEWYAGLDSTDEYLAYLGLSEGDAEYVRAIYDRRCEVTWECTIPPFERVSGVESVNEGIDTYGFQPYSDGAAFVATLRERGGWAAVDDAYDDPPTTTEQVIHPGAYPGEQPASVDLPSNPRGGWQVVGGDSIGEAGVFSMLWYQATQRGVGPVNPRTLYRPDAGAFDQLNYTARPSAGWGGDALVVYRNGERAGYVWATTWDTARDAREFASTYREVLASHGAERRSDGVWVVAEGGFADVFRVERDGRNVTITNAPTVDDLDAVNPRGNATAGGNESAS